MDTANIQTRKFADFTSVSRTDGGDLLLVHDGNGVKTITVENFKSDLGVTYHNAGAHNAIYRGKYLGSTVTQEQYKAIKAGTFEDLYIGDYWTINSMLYRIAAFDYYYYTGDITCRHHHVTLVPDQTLYKTPMNDSNTTTGAYYSSKLYTTGLTQAKSTIDGAFGADHVLSHRVYLQNAARDGRAVGGSWYDSRVEIMSETHCYGSTINANNSPDAARYTIDHSRYALFFYRPDLVRSNESFWLRDVCSTTRFAYVGSSGFASYVDASSNYGVRPAFSIYQA